MNKISTDNLKTLYGGASITGTVASALVKIVSLLYDAGKGLGSSFRRVGEENLCPLK